MPSVPDERRERIESDPFCRFLGIDLVDLEPGYAETELELRAELLNFQGAPHGAVVYALADAAFAAAGNAGEDTQVALECNVSYLAAPPPDATLTATAERTHESRRTAEYAVVVRDDAGERVATFRGRSFRRD